MIVVISPSTLFRELFELDITSFILSLPVTVVLVCLKT